MGVDGGRTKGERDLRIPVPNCGYIFQILRLFLKNLHVEFICIFIRSITKRN